VRLRDVWHVSQAGFFVDSPRTRQVKLSSPADLPDIDGECIKIKYSIKEVQGSDHPIDIVLLLTKRKPEPGSTEIKLMHQN